MCTLREHEINNAHPGLLVVLYGLIEAPQMHFNDLCRGVDHVDTHNDVVYELVKQDSMLPLGLCHSLFYTLRY